MESWPRCGVTNSVRRCRAIHAGERVDLGDIPIEKPANWRIPLVLQGFGIWARFSETTWDNIDINSSGAAQNGNGMKKIARPRNHALEQAFTIGRSGLAFPEVAPVAVLEKLAARPLTKTG